MPLNTYNDLKYFHTIDKDKQYQIVAVWIHNDKIWSDTYQYKNGEFYEKDERAKFVDTKKLDWFDQIPQKYFIVQEI